MQSRFGNHGWLTPAAPGARPSFAGKSCLAMRSRTRTKSGGRQPAVALGNAFARAIDHTARDDRLANQERRASARRGSQPHRQRQSPTHTRQPTGQTRAGGVSPPWFREPHLQRRRRTVRRIFARAPGAAGVSPPWGWGSHLQLVAKVAGWLLASAARRGLVGAGVSVVYRECYAVAFREPRLAYASRSWCTTVVRREIISYNAESNPY